MNFAENKSWPTNVVWAGRPTQVVGGSMRAGSPTGSGSIPSKGMAAMLCAVEGEASYLALGHALARVSPEAAQLCTVSDRQPLCHSPHRLEELLVCAGHRTGCRLPRNRLPRLHGVLELLGGARAHACWRRRMGSVDGWPLASPETEQREVTTLDGRRHG
jgi:hypothetical protein